MSVGVPYVHWKINDEVQLAEIDPVYLWGTVIETNKGPLDTPVFITDAEQGKKIFNFNFEPFFVNGGRALVVMRAYATDGTFGPSYGKFDFLLDEEFSYVYVDYDYYNEDDEYPKATVKLDITNPGEGNIIDFTSYSDDETATSYGSGKAEIIKMTRTQTVVKVVENSVEGFVNNEYVVKDTKLEADKFYSLYEKSGAAVGIKIKATFDSGNDEVLIERPKVDPEGKEFNVAFSQGRWRLSDKNGEINHYYKDNEGTIHKAKKRLNSQLGTTDYYTDDEAQTITEAGYTLFTKAYNESDIVRTIIAKEQIIDADEAVATITAKYPGDYEVPISVQKDIRQGYRVSVKDSDDYTIMLSGATTLNYITQRINERAQNVIAEVTEEGAKIEKAFTQSLQLPPLVNAEDITQGYYSPDNLEEYTAYAQAHRLPIGTIFQKVKDEDGKYVVDDAGYTFELQQTVTYLADGSNGPWDEKAFRLPADKVVAAHQEALDHLANIKLSGIFCMYGEDELINIYANHVSTTEPQGMNSSEVCKWRSLIIGANADDRKTDNPNDPGFNLCDKAIALDSADILFLGQGLIDTGYEPETGYIAQESDANALPGQLLPFQCTQYVAGLRSGLFYGASIFGGQSSKRIRGVGTLDIAPLFDGESKLLWQPQNYVELNEAGVLTFTKDYGQISLLDGVTTRQSPLEEDEEGVQSIVKYAKHAVHEVLQTYIGRNITGDLQSAMDVAVQEVLSGMATQDLTLVDLADEGYAAYDVDIILAPKSNAKQILAKAYVYLKITPVHALRQIEVELTVQ